MAAMSLRVFISLYSAVMMMCLLSFTMMLMKKDFLSWGGSPPHSINPKMKKCLRTKNINKVLVHPLLENPVVVPKVSVQALPEQLLHLIDSVHGALANQSNFEEVSVHGSDVVDDTKIGEIQCCLPCTLR
eukprot:TRINITY_DN9539_c0_g1_i2.p2 TRINITY_DN9539_c0_g1~~TRINITY_DN9539_c0_g1_i2.p2  ORF type:complete len:130 (-),score=40.47 TRINITY_DN9539_c0_g1_i2:11-400(-)